MAKNKELTLKPTRRLNIGLLFILATLFITVSLWYLAKSDFVSEVTSSPMLAATQIVSLLGTVLLSWSMLLSTRLNFLETIFSGLDKLYVMHKKVSIYGMLLLFAHPLTLALTRFPDTIFQLKFFLPIHGQLTLDLGVISFWIFIILTVITLFIKLPYETWRWFHKFYGLALAFGFLHLLTVPSDTTIYPVLGYWMIGITGTGLAAYLYTQFFYKKITPHYRYSVSNIQQKGDTFLLSLKPKNRKMNYAPGQFAYISFIDSQVKKELHPFSITSHPDEPQLSFAIKALGDFTKSLSSLRTGDTAVIYGPYGRFYEVADDHFSDLVFISGGIGVAPFVSMIKEVAKQQANRKVSMYYCTKCKTDACFDLLLTEILDTVPNALYLNQCSEINGRLTADTLMKRISNIANTKVLFCGPHAMMQSIARALVHHGVPKSNIIIEDFSFT